MNWKRSGGTWVSLNRGAMTMEDHEKPQSGEPVSRSRFKPRISPVGVKNITTMSAHSANLIFQRFEENTSTCLNAKLCLSFLSISFIGGDEECI
jgi:hypothetical protein